MIKKIIFDLDNTLIMWKDEYLAAIKRALEENNIDADYVYTSNLFDSYELSHDHYNKELLLKYVNEHLEHKMTSKALDDFLNYIGYMSEENQDVIDTLDYLSKKYELVVLTRWFRDPQAKRLEHASILKYFKEVIGGEEVMKPHKKAFELAIGDYDASECIMVGDTYDIDLTPADNVGIKPIFMNPKNLDNPKNYQEIKSIKELMNLL